jgi:hypothetical protein
MVCRIHSSRMKARSGLSRMAWKYCVNFTVHCLPETYADEKP